MGTDKEKQKTSQESWQEVDKDKQQEILNNALYNLRKEVEAKEHKDPK